MTLCLSIGFEDYAGALEVVCPAGSSLPCIRSVPLHVPAYEYAEDLRFYEGARPKAVDNFHIASIIPPQRPIDEDQEMQLTIRVDMDYSLAIKVETSGSTQECNCRARAPVAGNLKDIEFMHQASDHYQVEDQQRSVLYRQLNRSYILSQNIHKLHTRLVHESGELNTALYIVNNKLTMHQEICVLYLQQIDADCNHSHYPYFNSSSELPGVSSCMMDTDKQ
ncbi:hypothetical protein SISNIDRAFT_471915 [Sistotremastrum niveocremeum HHB9708]|uniref:Uncharacterized protein n=1 Tax=Sistotremastrum niveocremeum HHB9708 TaxID=1314777 RepID=A0A164M2F5_9AGAM|nr:hypothetical protein SISNIDRAFT_471915 [Sistotremastrum niveocremeum HHB9708]